MTRPPNIATSTAPSVEPSGLLSERIAWVRRRGTIALATSGVSVTVSFVLALVACAMALDWLLNLPVSWRAFLLTVESAAIGACLWRQVARPLARRPDPEGAALLAERHLPEFRGRLIASLQLTVPHRLPAGASAAMVRELVRETEVIAHTVDWRAVVSLAGAVRAALIAALSILVAGALFVTARPASAGLLRRVFLSREEVPRKTRIVSLPGDELIGRGDPWTLKISADGVLPRFGRVEILTLSGQKSDLVLEPVPGQNARYAAALENAQETFTYRVFLNDAISPTRRVEVVPRPGLAALECDQEFPAYTGIKGVRKNLGDLSILAGSRLRFRALATQPIRSGQLRLAGIDRAIPLQVDSADARRLSAELVVPTNGLTGFSFHLADTRGLESRRETVYRLDVIPDRPPVVRLTYPDRRETLATTGARVLLGLEAADDFAINALRLRHRAKVGTETREGTIPLRFTAGEGGVVRHRFEWELGRVNPPFPEGASVEYWIEAEDNNTATGPGVGSSEKRMLRVVSEAEKRADLLNRAGEFLGGLGTVAIDQERLNKTLGTLIQEEVRP